MLFFSLLPSSCPLYKGFLLSCGRFCCNPGFHQLRWRNGSFNLLGSCPVFGVWIALVHIFIIFSLHMDLLKWEIPWIILPWLAASTMHLDNQEKPPNPSLKDFFHPAEECGVTSKMCAHTWAYTAWFTLSHVPLSPISVLWRIRLPCQWKYMSSLCDTP